MYILLCSLLKPANLARREIGKSTMDGLLDAGLSGIGLLDAGLPNDVPARCRAFRNWPARCRASEDCLLQRRASEIVERGFHRTVNAL